MVEIISLHPSLIQNYRSPSWGLVANTAMCGLAVGFLFGPGAAVASMVTHMALSYLNGENSQSSWLPLNARVIEDIKEQWSNHPPFFQAQIIAGIMLRILHIPINQVALVWLKSCLSSPAALIYAIFRICILGPVIEEIVFRGFLQEKIKDVQKYIWGPAQANSPFHKTGRIALQAFLFSACHVSSSQGLFNVVILLSTGVMGYILGKIKETRNHLWGSILMHSHVNSSCTARVILFGT